ncbi:ABC transporter permease [Marinicrinis lubricantis]|uniref:ABC transporter permease n=1 Tax=Marinicrinis lubricantis TaxID=2086470 RepID=A0ABW1IJA9_9BACL
MSNIPSTDPKAASSSLFQKFKFPNKAKKGIVLIPFLVILFVFVIVSVAPGLFAKHDPVLTELSIRLQPPGFTDSHGSAYMWGTDELGRDIFSRVIHGAKVSLLVGVSAVLLSGVIGGLLGMLAGYYRGIIGTVIMRLADILLSIPFLLLAILTVAVLGPNLMNLIIVLGIVRWPRYARVAYSATLSTVNRDFVKASAALGARPRRLLMKHILPELIPPLVVVATLEFGLMIMFEASLSFIGLGVQPPDPSWGSMLSTGQNYVNTAWWIATFPGIAIFLVVLSINTIGDYVRDRLDPKNQKR